MEAKELRIGNYINDGKEDTYIFALDEDGINGITNPNDGLEIEYENVSPIKLTEEWLIKLGFKENEGYYKLNDFIFSFGKYWNSIELNQGSEYTGLALENMKYVHQLQNLYFALTNKELEFTS